MEYQVERGALFVLSPSCPMGCMCKRVRDCKGDFSNKFFMVIDRAIQAIHVGAMKISLGDAVAFPDGAIPLQQHYIRFLDPSCSMLGNMFTPLAASAAEKQRSTGELQEKLELL